MENTKCEVGTVKSLDLITLQETYIKEIEITELEDYAVITSREERGRYVTGAIVSKEIKEDVKKFASTLKILYYIKEKVEEDKDMFYRNLGRTYNKLNRNVIMVVLEGALLFSSYKI